MKLKKQHYMLIFIFLAVLSFRLYFSFQTDYFTGDESYYILRHVEHIKETGLPLYDDELSYSGRSLFYSPFFHYILAFFDLFMPIVLVGKIIPNLFASLIVIGAYFLTLEITKQWRAAIIASFTAGFIPIFIRETINSITVFSLMIPLLFFILYFILKTANEKIYITPLIILTGVFIFLDILSFIFILALIVYFFLSKSEDIQQDRTELEIILFSCFLFFWLYFIIFKEAFLLHGIGIIWQNIPNILLINYFSEITILESIFTIGIVPFIFGIFIIYDYIFKRRSKSIYLLISIALSAFVLTWFKLMPLVTGLMFLGSILTILFGQYMKNFIVFVNKTKFNKKLPLFLYIFLLVIIFTSAFPSYIYARNSIKGSVDEESIEAYNWIKENTNEDSVVLGAISEGHLITYFSKRKNVIDSNFLLIENINQRVKDIERIYTTPYTIEAVRLLNKYGVDYIILSNNVHNSYKVNKLVYTNEDCFKLRYNETIKIYKSTCKIEEQND